MTTQTPCEPLSPRDRARGALVGLAVGDALGTTLEFGPRRKIGSDDYLEDIVGGGPFNLAPGQWTDDTAMALALANSLVQTGGSLIATDLLTRFEAWYTSGAYSCTGDCFDIGNQTRAAIDAFTRHGRELNNRDPDKQGNGGIMRLAPAALVAKTRTEARGVARSQSETTHASPLCLTVAGVLGSLLFDLIGGEKLNVALRKVPGTPEITSRSRPEVKSDGHVGNCFEASVWSVVLTGTFRDAVVKAVNLGGDADTTGAVTGQIAGALYGHSGIPAEWRAKVAWHDEIVALADKLFDLRGRS